MDASVNRIPLALKDRAMLIAIRSGRARLEGIEYSLEELRLLVKTAGAITVETRIVRRDVLDAAFIVGKGYVEELGKVIAEKEIKLIIFDLNNIRPAQIRNLEERLKCRVIGRDEVIMDIFARRARSAESQIQVELAQLKYILPRLKGLGGVLSRLGGGIGTRGPGEKMLETDRRHILRRIHVLSKKLDLIKLHRERTRSSRAREFHGAVVGYTNAGKSTLINLLARDDLFVEDRLFATLDSYTRTVYLSDGKNILLTDTVGFIRNLPMHLIDSFRSTLEEIQHAQFLIHVIDLTANDVTTNIATVENEMVRLEASGKPTIPFFNKSDLVTDESRINIIKTRYPDAIIGSAIRSEGILELKNRLLHLMESDTISC